MLYLNRTSRPPLEDVKPADPQHILGFSTDTGLPDCPQLKIVRLNGSIFFGAVNHLAEALQMIDERNPRHRHVLLVASGINFVDLAGAHLLAQEARRRRAMGGGALPVQPEKRTNGNAQALWRVRRDRRRQFLPAR